MKMCTECSKHKELSHFYSHPRLNKTTGETRLYHFPCCKDCGSAKKRNKDRTRDGIAKTLHTSQRCHSRHRGYPSPTYTENELRTWLHAQPNFESIFLAWEQGGFVSNLKPSCNRKDDYQGYTLSNIELTTWQGNKNAWAKDCVLGKNRKISRPVLQYSLEGHLLKEFFSIQDASRALNIPHANIVKTCTGTRRSAGGYHWKYKDPRSAPKHTGFIGGS